MTGIFSIHMYTNESVSQKDVLISDMFLYPLFIYTESTVLRCRESVQKAIETKVDGICPTNYQNLSYEPTVRNKSYGKFEFEICPTIQSGFCPTVNLRSEFVLRPNPDFVQR